MGVATRKGASERAQTDGGKVRLLAILEDAKTRVSLASFAHAQPRGSTQHARAGE